MQTAWKRLPSPGGAGCGARPGRSASCAAPACRRPRNFRHHRRLGGANRSAARRGRAERRTPGRAGAGFLRTALLFAHLHIELATVDLAAVERGDCLRRGTLGGDVDKTIAQTRPGRGVAGDDRAQHDAIGIEGLGQPLIGEVGRQIPDKHVALAAACPHPTRLSRRPLRLRYQCPYTPRQCGEPGIVCNAALRRRDASPP